MSRRSYDSSGRRDVAARAQERVVQAATELMVARGYAATTVADIAAAAEVSVPLVYAAFGNKATLLKRVLDVAIVGDHQPVPVRDRPSVAAIHAATSVRKRCELNAALISDVHSRTAHLVDVVRDAAGTDPEVAALWARQDAGRRAGMREFVGVLAAAGQLAGDPENAADVIWALTDPTIYRRLVIERGWSTADYQRWLGEAIYHSVKRAPK